MSLFLKIFLWFWLAMALIVGAITLVNWSTRMAPLARQWRTFVGDAITLNSQTAVQIYENQGLEGLEEYFDRQKTRRRINSIGFFDKNKSLIAGDLKFAEVSELFDRALATDAPEFIRLPDRTYGAKRVVLDDGETYIYVLELRRFRPPVFFTQRSLLRLLSVILIGGLFCYLLARYVTSPIEKLRAATQKVSEGDFETEVSKGFGNRKDEIALLSKDFDEMAGRIKNLIGSEKRLTQDISHELRSPLARMNVALELVRSKTTPDSTKLLDRIEKESERLNELIGQLLTLSKLETGSQSFEKHEINLKRLVEEISADADFEARGNKKSVKIEQADDAKVFGNEQLIRSAVDNVLRNAIRYTKPETAVVVTLKTGQKEAVISIEDFGDGVPEDELEKLFKPFYRIQEARDRKSGGIGLGLAIAEQAVRSHNGSITATNNNNGLFIEITLPILTS